MLVKESVMSKFPVQASGGGKPRRGDGVSDPEAGGRTGAGESGGGAYVDPEQVKGDTNQSVLGAHGGQSNMAYHGPGDAEDGGGNPNATTKAD
jgi:hypothetical protein